MNYPDREDLYKGKFTDGDPVAGIAASVISAEQINALYDEMIAVIEEGGLTQNENVLSQLAQSVKNQIRGEEVLITRGDANQIVLTTPAGKQPVKVLRDYDKIHFRVGLSNTESNVTLAIDGLAPVVVTSVTGSNQLLKGALATLTYLDGSFWLTQQINPKTGNDVKDIGKLIVDTTDLVDTGEIALNGAELKRAEHPVFWAKVQATSNLIDQASKDADLQTYAGYYGTGDGETTFTLPTLGGEFIRGYDNGRGVDAGREFSSHQMGSVVYQPGYIGDAINRAPASGYFDGHGTFGDTYDDGFQSNVGQGNDIEEYGIKAPSYTQPYSTADGTANSGNTYNIYKGTRPRNIAYFFKTRI